MSKYFVADAGAARGDGSARMIEITGDDVGLDGDPASCEVRRLPDARRVLVRLNGRSAVGFAERRDGLWHIELEGRAFSIRVENERAYHLRELTAEAAPSGAPAELRAPMPGLVVRVAVAPGDAVQAGDGLVVMEAMKMENELRADRAGQVDEVHVEQGATVNRDDVLVTFASLEATSDE